MHLPMCYEMNLLGSTVQELFCFVLGFFFWGGGKEYWESQQFFFLNFSCFERMQQVKVTLNKLNKKELHGA